MKAQHAQQLHFNAAFQNAENILGGIKLEYFLALWIFLATTVLMAWVAWRLYYRGSQRGEGLTFLKFLLPSSIYFHRSTKTDIQLSFINQIFSPLSLALVAFATGTFASLVSRGLGGLAPGYEPSFEAGFWSLFGFVFMIVLVSDFATYVMHRLFHEVPSLWEVHKVHHSAEVMSPLTIFRRHPVFDLAGRGLKAVLAGPLQGLVFFIWAGPVDLTTAFAANLVFGLLHNFGAGLRHSHIWLSYGPWLERILISPAQHQIHHSKKPEHLNKNYGQVFAIWDWIFGSLHIPDRYEELEFGVQDAPSADFAGLKNGLLRPLHRGWLKFRKLAIDPDK